VQHAYDVTWALAPSPPQAARCYNYVALAMYEACVPLMPGYRSLGGSLTGLGRLPAARGRIDAVTALATSAHEVSQSLYAAAPAESLATLTALRDVQVAQRRSAGVPPGVLQNSVRHGRAVAAALAAWIATDGYADIVGRPYTPPTGGPSLWESTPPNYRPAIEPYWAQVRPMVMRSSDEIVPEPHVPFSSDPTSAFYAQALHVVHAQRTLTDPQRDIASFWSDNPVFSGLPSGHWMLLTSQVVSAQQLPLSVALETFVRLGITLHEAFVSCWTHKYISNLLRPVTYIQRYIDPAFTTFVNTPQFPEYTSGHSVASAAAATVLTDLIGDDVPIHDDSHAERSMPARDFTSFTHAAQEAAASRIYGGIHYPMGIEHGLTHGDEVGAVVLARLHTRR